MKMSEKYKAIIIDDEIRARSLLRGMLGEIAPEIEVAAEAEDLPNGVKAIRRLQPQLVFLDIEMPGHSGLELLDFFNDDEISFEIVFTTAYNNYAIKAFKLSAIDYLLKPISADELREAVDRFTRKKREASRIADYHALRENLSSQSNKRIAVPSGNSIKFIDAENIIFLKADSSYTEIFFTDGTQLVVSRTLKNFDDIFDSSGTFFRCHKSYIVNITYISEYVKSDGGYLMMKNGNQVSVSPDRVDELMNKISFIKR
jgi:two-component system, LytTR family, response regulator